MKYGIFLNTALPVRSEAKESSEMVDQLIFGDTCIITEEIDNFYFIKNTFDAYSGWVDKKMLSIIPVEVYQELLDAPVFRTNVPVADIFCLTDKTIYRLSLGSRLPLFDHETNKFEIDGKVFQIHPSFVTYITHSDKKNIEATAMLFLNAPYLWGGKNILGIDCSGFVQLTFALNGFWLPRDASMQIEVGLEVASLLEAQIGDLLFFEKQGKVSHVGIYLGDGKIIHASGKVRLDRVDGEGIYNQELSVYTHKIASIRRIQ